MVFRQIECLLTGSPRCNANCLDRGCKQDLHDWKNKCVVLFFVILRLMEGRAFRQAQGLERTRRVETALSRPLFFLACPVRTCSNRGHPPASLSSDLFGGSGGSSFVSVFNWDLYFIFRISSLEFRVFQQRGVAGVPWNYSMNEKIV